MVGGELAGFVGDEGDLIGASFEDDLHELIGGVAFDVKFRADGFFELVDVFVPGVALVGTGVDGDTLGPEIFAVAGDLQQVGIIGSAAVADEGDLVEVDA